MQIKKIFQDHVINIISSLVNDGVFVSRPDISRVVVDTPRDTSHGDIAINAAMVLSKDARMAPRELAEIIQSKLSELGDVQKSEIAGPGFINLSLKADFWQRQLTEVLKYKTNYGDSNFGESKKVNVEYVSANPTGPLHVAHARGAVTGDVLANLLRKVGYDVTTEYYINDAGNQVDVLARSAYFRYCEALGHDVGEIPDGLYPGDYMIEVGHCLASEEGDKWYGVDEVEWIKLFREVTVEMMMKTVRSDLAALGIKQDIFTSERALVDAGIVNDVFNDLNSKELIYKGVLEPPKGMKPDDWERREQTLFKSTSFGDDIDRPLKKSDGSWTYFANDIAYHYDKHRRGYEFMINIFGADHSGYVKRMKAAVSAITGRSDTLNIKLCQIVHLKKGGKPIRMSKRSGNFITLRDLIDEVGKDVVRFIMLTRKNDTQMEFDLKKVVDHSRDNPVFYLQYAHARCCSVLRNAPEILGNPKLTLNLLHDADFSKLDDPGELDLIRQVVSWPQVVEAAAEVQEPHRLAYYLNDLAELFHALWNKGRDNSSLRFVNSENPDLTVARLALVQAVAFVIASGLNVFGIEPVEELR
ncbi:MAG: arginine--tRNA ligase [Magnetovibrio sp.]|nr:arginine--tRNA ligase [Magnetovibrio sp.]